MAVTTRMVLINANPSWPQHVGISGSNMGRKFALTSLQLIQCSRTNFGSGIYSLPISFWYLFRLFDTVAALGRLDHNVDNG